MYEVIKSEIEYQLELGKRNFVIYPYGENGKLTKKVLNEEFGIKEKYVVDNYACVKDDNIKDVSYMREDYKNDDFTILLAIAPKRRFSPIIHQQISDFAEQNRVVDVLALSTYLKPHTYFRPIRMWDRPRVAAIECVSREIYRNEVQGAVAEAGVYKGNTARFINQYFPDRKLYLFDTFTGFDEKDQASDDANGLYNEKLDFKDTSIELVLQKMVYPQNCIIKQGWFPKSAEDVDDIFSFVRLDMDLYDPIYAGLEFFYPKMAKGGYILVHDCRSKNFDGARKALIDFCNKYKLGYVNMPDELGTAIIAVGR